MAIVGRLDYERLEFIFLEYKVLLPVTSHPVIVVVEENAYLFQSRWATEALADPLVIVAAVARVWARLSDTVTVATDQIINSSRKFKILLRILCSCVGFPVVVTDLEVCDSLIR